MRRRHLLVVAGAVLGCAAPAHGAVITEFEVFTPFTSGGGEVNGVVRASDGNFWVAETRADKVAKVGTDGKLVAQIPLPAGAKPTGVATGPNDTVWVSLPGTKQLARITVASSDVRYISTESAGPTCGPVALVQGPANRMYFTSPQADGCAEAPRVGRVDAEGGNLQTAGGVGSAYDIETLGGKLFVTHPTEGVIRRLNGDLATEATTAGVGDTPDGIAAGPDGKVWFTLFNETGGVGRIAPDFAPGAQPENVFLPPRPLKYAFGIAAGPEGAMYVAARDSSIVARVRMDGTFAIYDVPNSRWPWQLAQGADEDLWFTDIYGNRLTRLISTRPRAGVGAATVQSPTAAGVSGTINPRGSTTTARFEYGPTPAYGTSTPPQSFPASVADSPVGAALAGLQPNTTYHFRLVAANEEGVTATPNAAFTTPPAPRPTPRVGFRYNWRHLPARNRRSVRFTSLKVLGLTKGARLRISCRGGTRKRCPFSRPKTIRRTGARRNLAPLLRKRYLRPGAVVELRATMKGAIGRVVKLAINKRAVPVDRTYCIPIGKTRAQRSCPG